MEGHPRTNNVQASHLTFVQMAGYVSTGLSNYARPAANPLLSRIRRGRRSGLPTKAIYSVGNVPATDGVSCKEELSGHLAFEGIELLGRKEFAARFNRLDH